MKNKNFKFIDLFAGIGGLRIGFDELGGSCVCSSELNKFAQKTYTAAYNEEPVGDIKDINASELPDFDILTGGFPCQPFSSAGKKKGFSDTRGTLFFEVERIIREKRPKSFLLENVKGLTHHDKGHTFEVIIETLEALDYHIKYKVLNAKDFGLPQNRERIFIVGFSDKTHFDLFEFPEGSKIKTRLGDILEDTVPDKYTISDKLWAGHKRRLAEHKKKGNGFGYRLFNHDSEYTGTISARYNKDGSEILIEQIGKNPRKLTPLEAARLQGFPDSLVHKAQEAGLSDTQLYIQIGNAVPVAVTKEVSANMLIAMEGEVI